MATENGCGDCWGAGIVEVDGVGGGPEGELREGGEGQEGEKRGGKGS